MLKQLQAMGAQVAAAVASVTAKRAAVAATNAATGSHAPAVAPTTGANQSACPAVDAPATWAKVAAKAPATGAPLTPQKPEKTDDGGTGSSGKGPLTLEQVLAADWSKGFRAAGAQHSPNKRSRANKDENDEDGMSDKGDVD